MVIENASQQPSADLATRRRSARDVVLMVDPRLSDPDPHELTRLLTSVPEGWSRTQIAGRTWAVTRTTHAGGKVISLNAERLNDNEQLAANVWLTSKGPVLRPCEIPAENVMTFLRSASKAYYASADGI